MRKYISVSLLGLFGAVLGAIVAYYAIQWYIGRYMINTDFELDKTSCHEITWFSTEPCWAYQ